MLLRLSRSNVCFLLGCLVTGSFLTGLRAQQQPIGALPSIVYTARDFGRRISPLSVDRLGDVIERAESGSLRVRSSTGGLRVLVDPSMPGAPADVSDPAVSYDASKIVFAGFSPADKAWRIYEVGADGSGLRQVTQSDRQVDLTHFGGAASALQNYDDFDPAYLPDGRIVFVSTRYPGIAPDRRFRATNLYVVDSQGDGAHRITSERFGADTPTVDPKTGEIVYSRWWRSPPSAGVARVGRDDVPNVLAGGRGDIQPREAGQGPPLPVAEEVPPGSPGYDQVGRGANGIGRPLGTPGAGLDGIGIVDFPGLNNWFLASIRPDGDGMQMFSGVGLDRRQTQAYRPSFREDGTAIGFFLPTTPFLGQPGNFGLRIFSAGDAVPEELGGPQDFLPSLLPDDFLGELPDGRILGASFFYSSGEPLGDGLVLVSGARDGDADWGVFAQEAKPGAVPLPVPGISEPGISELDAVPLVARAVPPVIVDNPEIPTLDDFVPRTVEEAFEHGGKLKFQCENVFFNPPVDSPLPDTLPVGKKLFIEFFMNPQRGSVAGSDEPLLIARKEIPPDGKIEVDLPAGVPLFEVIRRSDDRVALGRDGQIFHVGGHNYGVANSTGRCVGCHAGHTMVEVPEDFEWSNLAPSAVINANISRQAVRTRKGERFFGPENLLDRNTDPVASVWVLDEPNQLAVPDSGELTLRWGVPLRGRALVLHGVRPNLDFGIDLVVQNVTVTTALDGKIQQTFQTGQISADGTSIALDPERPFDMISASIQTSDVSGAYEGTSVPALAEVVVEARVLETSTPSSLFIRGDVNSDRNLNITDAISLLGSLFLGKARPSCEAAADVNNDGTINITDPIRLLNHLLRGNIDGIENGPLPAPFPRCGRVEEQSLTCDRDVCFSTDG